MDYPPLGGMTPEELKDLGARVEDLIDRIHVISAGDQAARCELEGAASALLKVRNFVAASIGRRVLDAAREERNE